MLTAIAAAIFTLSAIAVPAKPGKRIFTQSDGSTITVELKGDEHFHTYVTADGLTVGRLDHTGDFHYLTPEGLSEVMAHNPGARTQHEAEFLRLNAESLDIRKVASSRLNLSDFRRRSVMSAGIKAAAALQKAQPQVPNNGEARIPVILLCYKDMDFRDGENAKETFNEFFNGETVSARQYFIDQSNGKYRPQFDIYGPFKATGNRATYGGNDRYGNDKGAGRLVAEGCTALNSEIDFSIYDNDGDGICDVVVGLYAGVGEASYDDDDAIWPHQWELSASEFGRSLFFDGVTIDKYAVFNELSGTNTNNIDGIGTVCHEFSHCLGLPDFYETTYTFGYYGMGNWSLMCGGCYNNDGYTPIGYSAYEKEFMGWITIDEATPNTHYTLPVMNQGDEATDIAIKATSDRDPNEYFIFEARKRQGWDEYMPADGMLITHVTFNQEAWDNNTVNNSTPQRMCPVPADNRLNTSSESGDLWPGIGNTATSFTDTSRPAASLNGGGMLSKPLTEITLNDDGTVSFMYMKGALRPLSVPVICEHTVNTNTSFTANWTHDDAPDDVTYTIELTPHLDVQEILCTTFGEELQGGWELEQYNYTATWDVIYDCFKIGSSKNKGGIISPTFDAGTENMLSVVIEAASYGSDNSTIVVKTVDQSGKTISEKQQQLDASFGVYTFLLDCNPGEATRLVISTAAAKNRILLRYANIYSGDASSMFDGTTVRIRRAEIDNERITVTDITGNSYTFDDLKPGERYDYRIKAVALNTEEYSDSEWSMRSTVDLSTAGVENVAITPGTNADTPAEYFTLQGIRVDSRQLTPGVYVVRRGNSVTKTVIR